MLTGGESVCLGLVLEQEVTRSAGLQVRSDATPDARVAKTGLDDLSFSQTYISDDVENRALALIDPLEFFVTEVLFQTIGLSPTSRTRTGSKPTDRPRR